MLVHFLKDRLIREFSLKKIWSCIKIKKSLSSLKSSIVPLDVIGITYVCKYLFIGNKFVVFFKYFRYIIRNNVKCFILPFFWMLLFYNTNLLLIYLRVPAYIFNTFSIFLHEKIPKSISTFILSFVLTVSLN